MKVSLILIMLALTALLIGGCRPAESLPTPTIDEDQVATIVAATLSASEPAQETPPVTLTISPSTPTPTEEPRATSTAAPNPTATARTGEVSGRICFRTREIPAMRAYFQETGEDQTTELGINPGQTSYSIDLLPGEYIAYAWVEDFSIGGLYSQAVLCGMGIDCKDHAIIHFEVEAGETIEDIDICDWYAFNVPPPPDKSSEEIRGSISGQINYPGGSTPALHVVAYNIDTSYWYYSLSLSGAARFTISDLPPGTYNVVAYQRDGFAGGYADGSHNLIPVMVEAGETSSANINDWSAPAGSFPEDPTEW